ncbi:copper amine oxidase N-terminal domain-containing protein [Paenibacillus turpanensis]|uniref:copper amine oxidase N-terminal domain-containing protein n=1 Tax=Paenibacillus turpanensis TaxID=2689078 RepID=UPI001407A471|nr:copper amine oxidase N-terminal domain-containing protein [Paenibacillus turpanensis]
MKKTRSSLRLTLALTAAVLGTQVYPFSEQISAASYDTSFIKQVSDRYDQLETKYHDLYEADRKKITGDYEAFYDMTHDNHRTLTTLLENDLDYLTELLDDDYKKLAEQYSGSTYRDALSSYKREINPNYSSGALWKYATASNENYSSSTHWDYDTQINENYTSSLMWNYNNEVNPNYSGSTMWEFTNEMNPNYSGAKMWELRNEANANYSGSTMSEYRLGSLTRKEAETKINQILTEGEQDLQSIRDSAVASLNKTHQETVQELTELRDSTIQKLIKQRTRSLEDIMAIRKKHFGGELEIKPLQISFDKIKVTIDGELQFFEQPPVNLAGNVLVPMRAIFERLGAVLTWNAQEQSVTATKGSTSIYLKLGSMNATINGVEKPLNVAAQLVNSHTMVPVRFVSEALGAEVSWDANTQTVIIETK